MRMRRRIHVRATCMLSTPPMCSLCVCALLHCVYMIVFLSLLYMYVVDPTHVFAMFKF
jgi:hypothetical protein